MLLSTFIDPTWTTARLIFNNDYVIVIPNLYKTNKLGGKHAENFFTIVKDPEPFIQHLNFAKPESIYYANESVQLKTAKRKNRPPFVI